MQYLRVATVAAVVELCLLSFRPVSALADTLVYNVSLPGTDSHTGQTLLVDGTITFDTVSANISSSSLMAHTVGPPDPLFPNLPLEYPDNVNISIPFESGLGVDWNWVATPTQLRFVSPGPLRGGDGALWFTRIPGYGAAAFAALSFGEFTITSDIFGIQPVLPGETIIANVAYEAYAAYFQSRCCRKLPRGHCGPRAVGLRPCERDDRYWPFRFDLALPPCRTRPAADATAASGSRDSGGRSRAGLDRRFPRPDAAPPPIGETQPIAPAI